MMEIIRSLDEWKRPARRVAIAIGVFDGVHAGHREIIRRLVDGAVPTEAAPVVYTFDPHPRAVLQAPRSPRILTTLEEKSAILESLGVGILVVIPFTRRFAGTPAEEFVRTRMVARFRVARLVVGYDFRLGRGREGNGTVLGELGGQYGFSVDHVGPYEIDGRAVKSTWIRDEIEAGEVERASRLLRRHHSLAGTVVAGDGRGRTLGFPTANLEGWPPDKLLPANGVYAAFAEGPGKLHPALVNIGVRPTFGEGGERKVEAHLLDFEGNLVGKRLALHFVRRIRRERAFASPEELSAQIGRDREEGRGALREGSRKFVFTRF
ncbi:MAG: bifunctional riboflavin kinase/FAD synthetase [Candidatus Eisenbacteria bacterium]